MKKKKALPHLLVAGGLLILTLALAGVAKLAPGSWFARYTDFSRRAVGAVGSVTALVPVCLWQLALGLLLVVGLARLIRAFRKKQALVWLASALELVSLLVFLFVGLWGLNHFGPSLADQLGMEVRQYTDQELKTAAAYYAARAGDYALQVERDENGDPILPDFAGQSALAVAAYENLGAAVPRLADPVARVKPLLGSKAFAYMGVTGIYVCLTGEAGVSTETFGVAQPYTMCHELGHSLAIAAEDQANYVAFLACEASDSPVLKYSGYYNAFVYCYNALYDRDPAGAKSLWALCSEPMLHDCNVHVEHNRQYEGQVQETAQKVNDTYLKTFDEPAGVQSYGLVVDYLIAHFQEVNSVS